MQKIKILTNQTIFFYVIQLKNKSYHNNKISNSFCVWYDDVGDFQKYFSIENVLK
jgi:hypothetical protein